MEIKNILNIKEFKELIDKYKSITLEQIIDAWNNYISPTSDEIMQEFTGFGRISTCKLCLAIRKKLDYRYNSCDFCIYSKIEDYEDGECACVKHFTYNLISKSTNPEELYNAIQARIVYMESILEELKID